MSPHKDPEARRAYAREYWYTWKERNPKKVAEARRKYRAKKPEASREANRRYAARNPKKTACRKRLQWLVKSGQIEKPDVCSQCGSDYFVDGHHEDYSKPEVVEWLCRLCHADRRDYEYLSP